MTKFKVFQDENELPDGVVAAKRINSLEYDFDSLHTIIKEQCIDKGQPLVISNMNKSEGWNSQIFTLEQLKTYRGDAGITITTKKEKTKKYNLGNYIETVQKKYELDQQDQQTPLVEDLNIASQDLPTSDTDQHGESSTSNIKKYKPLQRDLEGVYAKDITCPLEYREAMNDFLPDYLLPHGNNDLFSFLPQRFQAENLMCYLGQDDTGTPIHRDLCGTMGHNIMTMASPGAYAEWIIVLNEQRDKLASYIKPTITENKRTNRQDRNNKIAKSSVTKSSFMESDRAWLTRHMLGNKSLKAQVIIQKPGDLIIIPSRAYHQVRNVGVSVKIAWNRITPQTLKYAFQDQLPLYRIINRPEVYKCKAIIYFTLDKWNEYLLNANTTDEVDRNIPLLKYGRDSFIQDCQILLDLYFNKALYPEILLPQDEKRIHIDGPGEFCTVICDFCHGDVFYRYYHCDKCDSYDLCMNCYVTGRSCQHANDMKMMQSPVPFSTLTDLYKSFIGNVNRVLNQQVFIDQSESLYCRIEDSPSLSTICHRIEYYRRRKGSTLNIMKCTHCLKNSKVSDLAEAGISLTSIFSRRSCPKAKKKTHNDLFVCKKCISKCDSCQPLIESNESITGYDLVYYAHPALDIRNWGAVYDFNMNKSCHYPTEYYDTYFDSIHEGSTTKVSRIGDGESSASTKKQVKKDRKRKNASTTSTVNEIKTEEELPTYTAKPASSTVKKGRPRKTAHSNDNEIKDEKLVYTSTSSANNKPSASNTYSVKRNREGEATYTNNQDSVVAVPVSTTAASSTKPAKRGRKRKVDTANDDNETKQEDSELPISVAAIHLGPLISKSSDFAATTSQRPIRRSIGRPRKIIKPVDSTPLIEEGPIAARLKSRNNLDKSTNEANNGKEPPFTKVDQAVNNQIQNIGDDIDISNNYGNENDDMELGSSNTTDVNGSPGNNNNELLVATSTDIIIKIASKRRCQPPKKDISSGKLPPNQSPDDRRRSPRLRRTVNYRIEEEIEIDGMASTSTSNLVESSHSKKRKNDSADGNNKNHNAVEYCKELVAAFSAINLKPIKPKTTHTDHNEDKGEKSVTSAADLIKYSQQLQNGIDSNENYVIKYDGGSPTSITPYQDARTEKGSKQKKGANYGNEANENKGSSSSISKSKKRKSDSKDTNDNEETQIEPAPRRLRLTMNNQPPADKKIPLSPKEVILVVHDKKFEKTNDGIRRSTRPRAQRKMSPYYV